MYLFVTAEAFSSSPVGLGRRSFTTAAQYTTEDFKGASEITYDLGQAVYIGQKPEIYFIQHPILLPVVTWTRVHTWRPISDSKTFVNLCSLFFPPAQLVPRPALG